MRHVLLSWMTQYYDTTLVGKQNKFLVYKALPNGRDDGTQGACRACMTTRAVGAAWTRASAAAERAAMPKHAPSPSARPATPATALCRSPCRPCRSPHCRPPLQAAAALPQSAAMLGHSVGSWSGTGLDPPGARPRCCRQAR